MTRDLHTILYVEDEPDIRHIARFALEHVGGFSVTACPSGQQALSVATDVNPDLILLDVMMPELDGPATLARLRELPPLADTPVVFLTAVTVPDDLAYLRGLGALDIIPKPIDPIDLPATVRAIWEQQEHRLDCTG